MHYPRRAKSTLAVMTFLSTDLLYWLYSFLVSTQNLRENKFLVGGSRAGGAPAVDSAAVAKYKDSKRQ